MRQSLEWLGDVVIVLVADEESSLLGLCLRACPTRRRPRVAVAVAAESEGRGGRGNNVLPVGQRLFEDTGYACKCLGPGPGGVMWVQ